MKLVKLNNRHRAFKEDGHKWAFRWDSYDLNTCPKVERVMHDMYGSQYRWNKENRPIWKSNFGHAVKGNHGYRPYWISFVNEADITVVLLSVE